MGFFQLDTILGILAHIIGCLKIVPPNMFRIVPFGDFHILFKLNSFTLFSSGVIVAHFTPTPCFFIDFADSTVISSFVASLFSILKSKYFISISKYGKINLSLMNCQIIFVISSPSISTKGFLTFILGII